MAKTTKQTHPFTHLKLEMDERDGYAHIYLRPVIFDATLDKIVSRSATGQYSDELVQPYARCQLTSDMERAYGWTVCYDGGVWMDIFELEAKTQTLKGVLGRMRKLREHEGECLTFAQYARRYARAVGITHVIRKAPRYGDWQVLDLDAMQRIVTELETEWLAQHGRAA